jgi:hypothetical protein
MGISVMNANRALRRNDDDFIATDLSGDGPTIVPRAGSRNCSMRANASHLDDGIGWAGSPHEPIDVLGSHSLVNLNVALTLKNGLRLEAYSTNISNALYAAGTIGNNAAIWGAPRQYGGRLGYSF